MPTLSLSSLVAAARRSLRVRGGILREVAGGQVRRVLDRLAPPAERPALPRMDGPELARHRMTEAADALLGKGATQAEAFRMLRLELNRLEQGGLRER
jgi:hypothetical protein